MSEFIDWLPPGVGSPVRQASVLSSSSSFSLLPLSLSLSPRLLCSPFSPLPPSSTSNAATSFHPRKRAKLPQVLYLLCLATLVSTHKHGSPLHFSSLAPSFTHRVVLILSLSLCPLPPLLPPPLERTHEFERVLGPARRAKLGTSRRHCLSWNISNPPLHSTASINLLA